MRRVQVNLTTNKEVREYIIKKMVTSLKQGKKLWTADGKVFSHRRHDLRWFDATAFLATKLQPEQYHYLGVKRMLLDVATVYEKTIVLPSGVEAKERLTYDEYFTRKIESRRKLEKVQRDFNSQVEGMNEYVDIDVLSSDPLIMDIFPEEVDCFTTMATELEFNAA